MNLFASTLANVCASISGIFQAGRQSAEPSLTVRLDYVGPDGEQWTTVNAIRPPKSPLRWTAAAFPADALLLALFAVVACIFRRPELAIIGIGRVATAGLNQLLDATLKTGVTSPVWYVGLVKAIVSDGAITSGAAVLTSASNPFAAGDAGRQIIVQGAGAAGADLFTTILTFTNSGSVTLAANAGTTVTGARFAFEGRAADTMASHAGFVESSAYSNANRPTWTPGAIAGGSVDNSGSVAAFTINATDFIFGAFLANQNTKGGSTGTLYGAGVNSGGIVIPVVNGGTLNVTVTNSVTAT